MDAELELLSKRVQYLEDLESIRNTWRDYCIRLDSGDWPALGDVFTEDAVVQLDGLDPVAPGRDGEYRGRGAIMDFYSATSTGASSGAGNQFATGHLSTNMQIDLQGDEATTLAYFFEIVGNDQVSIGTYQHRFRREADRWRFAFLRICIRYRARLEATEVGGQSLSEVLAQPV